MHDSNRGDRTKIGLIAGIIVAVLIAGAFISWGLWKAAEYERKADDHAREYAAYTDKKIRQTCLSLPPVYQQDCATEARHEQRDNERNEHDLVAQRQSALWALIMGAAAVIGMGLSVIGVFLVWTTFAETRRSNVIANDALDGQLRPWVSFGTDLHRLAYSSETFDVKIEMTFENRGTSPALYLTYVPVLFTEPRYGEQIFNNMPDYFDRDDAAHHQKTLFPGDTWVPQCLVSSLSVPAGEYPILLVVAARYRSPYSTRYRYTCKVYDFNDLSRPDELIVLRDGARFSRVEIVLREDVGYLAT